MKFAQERYFAEIDVEIAFQMQPYAIVKNRSYSLPVKCFIATGMTTVFIFSYRWWIAPFIRKERARRAEAFGLEYFDKMENHRK